MPASRYLADANLNWLRGSTFPAAPLTNLFISLHSADPGIDGDQTDVTVTLVPAGRIAVPVTGFSAPITAPGGVARECSNISAISITESAAAAAAVTYVGFWDAATDGNFLTYGLVNPPTNFLAGDIIRFPVGQLVIRLS
jgi:hypothetical protein